VAGCPPRQVRGFHTKAEPALMCSATRLPLARSAIDRDIVERHYQQRAIRKVGEAFSRMEREALLVMATGAGTTRSSSSPS
jgi:type I restriction enzyme R subunit